MIPGDPGDVWSWTSADTLMAFTLTPLTSGQATANTTFTPASISPSAAARQFLAVYAITGLSGNAPVVTGNNLTWVLETSSLGAGFGVALYSATGAPSAGSPQIVWDTPVDRCAWSIWEVTEAAGIVQSVGQNLGSTATPLITLAPFVAPENAAFGIFGTEGGVQGTATPGAGFTVIHNLEISLYATRFVTMWQATEDPTVTLTWQSTDSTRGVAFELALDGTGGGGDAQQEGGRYRYRFRY